MIPRQQQILQLLRQSGHCTIEQIRRKFTVSDMTVRRDLQALEDSGHVLRTHGGAAISERVAFEFSFMQRTKENRAAKQAIAAAAFAQLGTAKTVLLDSGTTTLTLAEHLRTAKGLTVLTTSLPIASTLQFSKEIDLLLLGGLLRRESPDLIGTLTESNLERLHAEVAFIGADAVDLCGEVYNESLQVGRMLEKMTAASDRFFILADSSKLGKKALARFGDLRKSAGLITDEEISPEIRRALKSAGVNLIIAPAVAGEK